MTKLLTAAEVADILNVNRGWVYDHATELGAIRLGSGPKPRLRFDLERLLDKFEDATRPAPPAERRPPGRPRRARHHADLLPIRGRVHE